MLALVTVLSSDLVGCCSNVRGMYWNPLSACSVCCRHSYFQESCPAWRPPFSPSPAARSSQSSQRGPRNEGTQNPLRLHIRIKPAVLLACAVCFHLASDSPDLSVPSLGFLSASPPVTPLPSLHALLPGGCLVLPYPPEFRAPILLS